MKHEIYYESGILPCCKFPQPKNLPLPFYCSCTEEKTGIKYLGPCANLLEKIETVKCDKCGHRGNEKDVYGCKIHGRVMTDSATHSSVKMGCNVCKAAELGYIPIEIQK